MTSTEQFEAWYLESWGRTEDNHDDSLFEKSPHDGEYYRFGVRLAWKAWQAASKASEQQLAAVVAENAGLKQAAEFATAPDMWVEQADGMLDYCYVDWYVDVLQAAMQTPATDAYLDEVRAQVWSEAKALAKSAVASDSVDHIDFLFDGKAAQLRQGVEHE